MLEGGRSNFGKGGFGEAEGFDEAPELQFGCADRNIIPLKSGARSLDPPIARTATHKKLRARTR